MRFFFRWFSRPQRSSGFSLVELSVVVAIISVVAALGLEAAANFVNSSAVSVSRDRIRAVDDAVARYFKIYGRLPCPALINTSPIAASSFGDEDCTIAVLTGTTIGGGVMAGMVPFRQLNMPMSAALDGFNNKIYYVVTKNLTTAGMTTNTFGYTAGTTATNGIAGIEVRTGQLAQPCNTGSCQTVADPTLTPSTGAAYFIFSSGPDQRGATSMQGTLQTPCAYSGGGDKRVDTQNCVFGDSTVSAKMSVTTIPFNVFYDNRYNAGLNMASYYDNVAIWRPKSQL